MTTEHSLRTDEATLVYDVHGPLPTEGGRPPLLMVGQPMGADGFRGLAAQFPERTVVAYDVRGLGRSTRHDGRTDLSPESNARDVHAIIEALGAGPVDLLGSSGGAITGLALVAAHPGDVVTLVAHEPPLFAVLPDADRLLAAERDLHTLYAEKGWGHAMAAFIGLTSWRGELTDDYTAQPKPDPAMFGLPADDDGRRDDPLLSGVSDAVTAYSPDLEALRRASTRVVLAVGADSADLVTGRTTDALAAALAQTPIVFPGGHGGFHEKPDEFAARLREVLS